MHSSADNIDFFISSIEMRAYAHYVFFRQAENTFSKSAFTPSHDTSFIRQNTFGKSAFTPSHDYY